MNKDTMTGFAVAVLLAVLVGGISKHDSDPQPPKCPAPLSGQQLIQRGYMEIDGEPGELQCVYSTAPYMTGWLRKNDF